jgi:hypothetical protein
MLITKPGAYRISEKDYHADNICETPSLSRSVIKDLISGCPAKAWNNHPRLNPNYKAKEKDIFDLGHAAHALLLEGLDKMAVIDADSWRKDSTKESATEARKNGKIPFLIEQAERISLMVIAAERQLVDSELGIKNLREEGDSELSYVWNEHGIWMRVRPDWIRRDRLLCLDYKSTGTSADPEEYNKIVAQTGLDIQGAFYPRGVLAVEHPANTQMFKPPEMVFMVQETYPPYLCTFIRLDPMFREMGEGKVHKGIAIWGDCLRNNRWPGYSNKIQTIDPKPWALASWEMKMQTT